MIGNAKLLLLAAVLSAAWITPTPAQEPANAAVTDLVREVSGVNRSLERVAAILQQLLEHQETDLVLKRIELRERRIAPLESELRKNRGELASLQAELDRLETLKRDWNERLREAARTDESAATELREMQMQFEQAFAVQSSQHGALEEQVRRLEDELAEGREQIKDLEALLLERIGR